MEQGPTIMMPSVSLDNNPPKLCINISPAHNGFSVYIEEVVKIKKTMTMKDLQKRIIPIQESLNKNMPTGDAEMDKIYRKKALEEQKEAEENEPSIELGLYIFTSLKELMAFVSFIYDNHDKELQEKSKPVKITSLKYNSQMP